MPARKKAGKAKTTATAAASKTAAAADGGHGHAHGPDDDHHGHSHGPGEDHSHGHGPAPVRGRKAGAAVSKSKPAAGSGASVNPTAKSEEVANTLATLLNMFPQNSHSPAPQLTSSYRGTQLITAIDMYKPFADIKVLFAGCDPRRDLNAVHPDTGESPLHKAAERGAVDVIKMLLNAGANMKQTNPTTGHMPFHVAALNDQHAAVHEFIKRGMDVNVRNNHGETAILLAAYYTHRATIGVLLAANADVSIGDWKGNNPMKVARNDAKEQIQKYLKQKNEIKKAELNPIPVVVADVVSSTRPFAGKMAALKAEVSAPAPAAAVSTVAGAVAQPAGSAPSAQRCAYATCGRVDVVLKGCGRCRLVAYCTKEHQIADFKTHKAWCLDAKTVRDDFDAVCNLTLPSNERAAATQRLGTPLDPHFVVSLAGIESLLDALSRETSVDAKLPSLVALRFILTNGPQTVDEDLTARFLLLNGFTTVLRAILNPALAVSVDTVLDTTRFLTSIVRRHRLARIVITRHLSADADSSALALIRSLVAFAADERVRNLWVGIVALLCEVDALHTHTGLVARVTGGAGGGAAILKPETLSHVQSLLKIDAISTARAVTALHSTSAANIAALQSGPQLAALRKLYLS